MHMPYAVLQEARALYKRCYSRRLEEGGQLRLCHAWLRMEREEGRWAGMRCWSCTGTC